MGAANLGLDPAERTGRPEGLDFDFAGRRLWRARRRFDSPASAAEWAFERAGPAIGEDADGRLRTRPAGTPRWGGDGLLLEAAGLNLLSRSSEFGDAAWMPIGAGAGSAPVVQGGVPDPLGGTGAARIAFSRGAGETGGDGSVLLQADVPTTPGAAYTGSLWVRADAPTAVLMRHVGAGAYLEIAAGPEWRRVHMTSIAVWPVSDFQIGLRGGYGAGATATVDVWNAQCEPGHATSDMVTGAGHGTRPADQLDFFHAPASHGTLIFEVTPDVVEGHRVILAADGAGRVEVRNGDLTASFGMAVASLDSVCTVGTRLKGALAWEPGRLTLAAGGAVVSTAAEVTLGATAVGRGAGDPFFGRLRRWRRLDRALGDAALAAVTS